MSEEVSKSQTGREELKAVGVRPCEQRLFHQSSLRLETQLQEERKPPKAVESPKQSGHYQPVRFVLDLSRDGRHSAQCEEAIVTETRPEPGRTPEVLHTFCSRVNLVI